MFQTVHCLFEQSGTFKNEFKKLGFSAFDYDIKDDFSQTNYIIDLFSEINKAYSGFASIFDCFDSDDLIFAFFPCIRFENQIMLSFRGQNYSMRDWCLRDKFVYDLKLIEELKEYYVYVNKLFIICLDRNFKLVMENPYSEEHFLRRYWCLCPSVIHYDRRDRGDYFKKPTQYWFLNFEPSFNVILEPITYHVFDGKNSITDIGSDFCDFSGSKNRSVARSMIHPEYANRFIREYLL